MKLKVVKKLWKMEVELEIAEDEELDYSVRKILEGVLKE